MTPLKKVAVFLLIVGAEKGQRMISLMDNGEIKAVIPELRKLTELSQEIQESIYAEFKELGYEDTMNPSEVVTIMRLLFNGSKIK